MSTVEPTLIQRLQKLPPQRMAEVADFVEFLAARVVVRVVLDTNTLVSALLSPHDPPRRLLDDARAQVFELCSSPVLVAELLDVVSREKFAQRLAAAG